MVNGDCILSPHSPVIFAKIGSSEPVPLGHLVFNMVQNTWDQLTKSVCGILATDLWWLISRYLDSECFHHPACCSVTPRWPTNQRLRTWQFRLRLPCRVLPFHCLQVRLAQDWRSKFGSERKINRFHPNVPWETHVKLEEQPVVSLCTPMLGQAPQQPEWGRGRGSGVVLPVTWRPEAFEAYQSAFASRGRMFPYDPYVSLVFFSGFPGRISRDEHLCSGQQALRLFGEGLAVVPESLPVCQGARSICKRCFNPYGGTWKHYVTMAWRIETVAACFNMFPVFEGKEGIQFMRSWENSSLQTHLCTVWGSFFRRLGIFVTATGGQRFFWFRFKGQRFWKRRSLKIPWASMIYFHFLQ